MKTIEQIDAAGQIKYNAAYQRSMRTTGAGASSLAYSDEAKAALVVYYRADLVAALAEIASLRASNPLAAIGRMEAALARTVDTTANPTITDMVKATLIARGFDGLFNDVGECACDVDALFPCSEPGGHCIAGYKAPCECGEGCDFDIVGEKP
jgi:hypothetical protein